MAFPCVSWLMNRLSAPLQASASHIPGAGGLLRPQPSSLMFQPGVWESVAQHIRTHPHQGRSLPTQAWVRAGPARSLPLTHQPCGPLHAPGPLPVLPLPQWTSQPTGSRGPTGKALRRCPPIPPHMSGVRLAQTSHPWAQGRPSPAGPRPRTRARLASGPSLHSGGSPAKGWRRPPLDGSEPEPKGHPKKEATRPSPACRLLLDHLQYRGKNILSVCDLPRPTEQTFSHF